MMCLQTPLMSAPRGPSAVMGLGRRTVADIQSPPVHGLHSRGQKSTRRGCPVNCRAEWRAGRLSVLPARLAPVISSRHRRQAVQGGSSMQTGSTRTAG